MFDGQRHACEGVFKVSMSDTDTPPKFLMRLCFLEHPHSPADVIVNFFSLNFGTGDMSTTQQILILVVDCYQL